MRTNLLFFAILASVMLLLGCISLGEKIGNSTGNASASNSTSPPQNGSGNASAGQGGANATQNATGNMTNQTVTPEPPKLYERYMARGFSFEYPINMSKQESTGSYGGIFTGTHEFDGQTGEIVIVSYINITSVYGMNKEEVLRANPTKAASDFLLADKRSDSAGSMLSGAYETDDVATFGVARDGYVAESPFKIRFGGSNKSYTGYAMDIYVPERTLLARTRIVALDPDKAKDIRDNFLLSFRIEAQ